jgi:hypothetical protein
MAVTETGISTAVQAEGYGGAADLAATPTILQGVWRRVLALRRWPFLEATQNLTAVVGSETVSTTPITDFSQIDAVRLSFGSEGYDPDFVPAQRIRALLTQNAQATGTPVYWSEYQGSILLYPRPERAYAVTVDYTRRPTYDPLAIVFPDQHQDVLVWGVIVRKAYRQRDWQGMQFAQEQYREHLEEMKITFGLEQRGGTLEVGHSGVWDEVSC